MIKVMPKNYIIFDKDMLNSMTISKKSTNFIVRFCKLTKIGRARISFSKDDLNQWAFPEFNNTDLIERLFENYNKAIKLNDE